MRYLLSLILLFVAMNCFATDIYVDNTLGANCTTGNYSIANRNCSGADGNAYTTVAGAVAVMTIGDDIYIRGGTYYEHDIYISGNDSGTSENYSSIQSYPGEWAKIDGQENCTDPAHAVFAMYASPLLQYFKFERLEITGGGLKDGGIDTVAAGINLSYAKNIIIRCCYIHDNLSDGPGGNPGGISLNTPMNCTIEYCYFNNNGTTGTLDGNACNIVFLSDYKDETEDDFDANKCTKENIVRYNLLSSTKGYSGGGIKHKNQQIFGEQDRSPTGMTYKLYGDKWHNNIITEAASFGLEAQQDFCQVYNNIIKFNDYSENDAIGIYIKKLSSAAEVYQSTVYNNTIIGTGDEIAGIHVSGLGSSKDFHPYSQVYNNIVDNFGDDYRREDISLGTNINSANDWDPLGSITLTDCPIDNNYIYRPADADEFAVCRADYFGGDNRFTTAEYNSSYSVTNYTNAYSAGDLLYQSTSGANQYKTEPAHIVDGTTTILNGGSSISHPYLTGVTIPSYIGAVNPNGIDSGLSWNPDSPDPDDAGWVDYVLNLANIFGNQNTMTISPTGNVAATFLPTGNVIMEFE